MLAGLDPGPIAFPQRISHIAVNCLLPENVCPFPAEHEASHAVHLRCVLDHHAANGFLSNARTSRAETHTRLPWWRY